MIIVYLSGLAVGWITTFFLVRKVIAPPDALKMDLLGNTTNEEAFIVNANEPLPLMAFNNLLKNAVQYSYNNSGSKCENIRWQEKN